MQIRDYISHEWQSVGSVQVALEKAGVIIPEITLLRTMSNMQSVVVKDGQVRQVAQAEA